MLYLYPDSSKKKKALHQHISSVSCLVFKRLTGEDCEDTNCKVCNETERMVDHSLSRAMINYLTRTKVKEIIKSKPQQLWELLEPFYSLISGYEVGEFDLYISAIQKKKSVRTSDETRIYGKFNRINKKLKKVFSYSALSNKKKSYNLYSLAASLNQNTCTYCNRLYTNTIIIDDADEAKSKISRPQFDHWFPNTSFPLLAVSFFNLIPSCTVCNSTLKRDHLFQIGTHYHPYLNRIMPNEIKFSYGYTDKTPNGLKVTLGTTNNSLEKVLKVFRIEEVYNAHTEEVKDLLKIKQLYNDRYLSILANKTYDGLKISKEELYRLAFGTYYDEASFEKRPFSKMKKDILEELEIIPKAK